MQQHSISSRLSTWRPATRRVFLVLCASVLLVLLAACSGLGSTSGSTNNNPGGANGTAGTTGTTSVNGATPTLPSSVDLTGATGTNYSITYPKTWKKTGSGNSVSYHDTTTSGNSLNVVVAPDPNGTVSADKFADANILVLEKTLTNSKVVNVASTITINGVTWSQRAITGTAKVGVQNVQLKAIMLVTTHPASSANTQTYEIIYEGPVFTFDLTNAIDFQPMLHSFKFTA